MKIKPSTRKLTRRSFFQTASASAAGFAVLPSYILGLNGAEPPSEKLNIAAIGCAGKGGDNLNNCASQNIVALCDVDWAHAAGSFKKFPKAKQYKDFRKMLEEQKDYDAVIVSTPDHTHAIAAMGAIKLGKHVYCEKPLTHTVWEARQLAEAARKQKVATQMGNQGQASGETRRLSEFIMGDAIGPVREAHLWTDRPARGLFEEYWPQGVDRPKDTPAVPKTLDWDLWLGPAPERPYHPMYVPFAWRGWWDFGTGALGDIGCHSFDPVFRALKPGAPLSVQASSTRVNGETYPLSSMVTYEFAARGSMPPLKLTWYDGGMRPPRPAELEDGQQMGATGALLVGEKGALLTSGGKYRIVSEARAKEYGEPPQKLPRSPGHYVEWFQACKGGAPAGSNFDWAGPLTETVLLGNIALRLQLREEMASKKLLWDPAAFKVTNSSRANEYLKREYRKGWSL